MNARARNWSCGEAGQPGVFTFALVPALIGMGLGQALRNRIGPQHFQRYFLLFLMPCGMERAWWSLR